MADFTELETKIIDYLDGSSPTAQRQQSDIMAQKFAGDKKVRATLNKLANDGLVIKEQEKGKSVFWHLAKEGVEVEPKQETNPPVEAEISKSEFITTFKAAGMTDARAELCANKVLNDQVTEEKVMKEWETNPANPNLNKVPAKNSTDKQKKHDEEAKAEKKEKKKAKKKSEPKYTRQDALVEALKSDNDPLNKDQIVALANDRYMFNGGKNNVKEAAWIYNNCIKILVGMGWVQIDDNGEHSIFVPKN